MKDISFLMSSLIAHRGYHNIEKGIPENTIKAFKRAKNKGYIIELDVQMLKDNTIVVYHDNNLKRLCNIDKDIKDCNYEDIKKLKIQNTNNYIPLLKNVLKIIDGKVPLIIEIKYYKEYGMLEEELMKLLEDYEGVYAVQSFSPKSVYWFKKNYKQIPRGLLIHNLSNEKIFKTIISNAILDTDFIGYDVRGIPNDYIERRKEKELILGWTIRSKFDYDRYEKYFDNLICENMEEFNINN